MSQRFPFFASSSGTQPQGQHNDQDPHMSTNGNGRPLASRSGHPAGGPAPQMAVAQAAGIDLTQFPPALVAQVLQAIQMGAIPMPPPPPPHASPIHVTKPAQAFKEARIADTAFASEAKGGKSKERVHSYPVYDQGNEGMEVDKEDGEVEDAEVGQPGNSRDFLNPSITGARAHSKTSRGEVDAKTDVSNGQEGPSSVQASSSNFSSSGIESEPRDFIYELHKAGYTFADLAKELGDTRPLRRIYQHLGLPTMTEHTDAARALPNDVEPRSKSLVKRSALTKPTAPSDRTEYLKRLAAARNKAPAKVVAPPPPVPPPTEHLRPSTTTSAQLNVSTPVQAGPSSKKSVPKVDEATAAAKRLLLKERLEALKAKQAAKLNSAQSAASGPTAVSTSTDTDDGALSILPKLVDSVVGKAATSRAIGDLGIGTREATRVVPSPHQTELPLQMATPSPISLHTSFRGLPGLQAGRLPGLPGLSMGGTIASASAHATQSTSTYPTAPSGTTTKPSSGSQDMQVGVKRAAGSDFEMPVETSRRPFGASRHNSSTEQFIIHASDDDENDEADDVNNRVSAMVNVQGGHLSKIEANVQKLKDKIAAIELAKSSRSNGSTPTGSMVYHSGKGNAVTAHSLSNSDSPTPQDASASIIHKSQELFAHAVINEKHTSHMGSMMTHAEQHHTIAPALSHLRPLPYDQVSEAQSAESSGRSSSSEDFYMTDERVMASSTPNDSHKSTLGTEGTVSKSQAPAENSLSFDQTSYKRADPEDEDNAVSQPRSLVRIILDDTASNASSSEDFSSAKMYGQAANGAHGTDSSHASLDETVVQHLYKSTVSEHQNGPTENTGDVDTDSTDDAIESSCASSRGSEDIDEDEYKPEDFDSDAMAASNSSASRSDIPVLSQVINAEIASGVQPLLSETVAASIQKPKKMFKPYVSHLTGFKDFRYHPDFLKVVPGGYKSLTYSNKIDPELAFCPRESVGEECDDPSCQWQHYNATALNDNELLMSLGMTRPPVESDEENKRWKEGLGTLIKQLRQSKMGSDVNVIAARICDYRRRFLGDDSKIVHLGS